VAVAGHDHADGALGRRIARQARRCRLRGAGRVCARFLAAEQLLAAPATAGRASREQPLVERAVTIAHPVAGMHRVDPARRNLEGGDRLLQLLAADGKGIDQVAVAPRGVAGVVGPARLLGVQLGDNRRRLGEGGHVGQQVEGQARVHDVDQAHRAALDEAEDEFRELVARHQVRQVPDLLGEGLDQVQAPILGRLGGDQRRRPALAVDVLEPLDRAPLPVAEIHPGGEVQDRSPGVAHVQ
jgi:hypothetical protein